MSHIGQLHSGLGRKHLVLGVETTKRGLDTGQVHIYRATSTIVVDYPGLAFHVASRGAAETKRKQKQPAKRNSHPGGREKGEGRRQTTG